MQSPRTFLHTFLGWNTQGDLGPLTFYTKSNHTLVIYLKAPPRKPPSLRQRIQRDRWHLAAKLWARLTPNQRHDWETASKRAHLRITGYNLFLHAQTTRDAPAITTIQRITAIDLWPNSA